LGNLIADPGGVTLQGKTKRFMSDFAPFIFNVNKPLSPDLHLTPRCQCSITPTISIQIHHCTLPPLPLIHIGHRSAFTGSSLCLLLELIGNFQQAPSSESRLSSLDSQSRGQSLSSLCRLGESLNTRQVLCSHQFRT
jgi:hypothetical protein